MALLILQTAHNLFFHEIAFQDSATIDVVIRTTTAAIFGYFISANFHSGGKGRSPGQPDPPVFLDPTTSSGSGALPKAEAGVRAAAEIPSPPGGSAHGVQEGPSSPDNHAQIVIVATIGIVCLILLLIAHHAAAMNMAAIATLSQLRDFISGSVGFLIGQSTQHKNPTP